MSVSTPENSGISHQWKILNLDQKINFWGEEEGGKQDTFSYKTKLKKDLRQVKLYNNDHLGE